MPSTPKMLDKLITLLDDMENELFDEKDGPWTYYNGVKYTRGEWKNFKRTVQQVQAYYFNRSDASNKYLKDRPTYNRLQRKISYYKHKPNKTLQDYEKLEQFERELTKFNAERKLEKIKKEKILEEQKQKTIENYAEVERNDKDDDWSK